MLAVTTKSLLRANCKATGTAPVDAGAAGPTPVAISSPCRKKSNKVTASWSFLAKAKIQTTHLVCGISAPVLLLGALPQAKSLRAENNTRIFPQPVSSPTGCSDCCFEWLEKYPASFCDIHTHFR